MTIQNNTARHLMYEWHSGMSSPFYAAASSGLCASFSELAHECTNIDEPDRTKLMGWIQKRQRKYHEVIIKGRPYAILPWVSKAYFPKVTE